MTAQEIINLQTTKTEKMRLLFELGLTRRQVSEMLGVGYGFAQNVYAKLHGTSRTNRRTIQELVQEATFNFLFNRNFGVEIEAYGVTRRALALALRNEGIEVQEEGYNHETRTWWKIVSDGSIQGQDSFELVSPILNGENGLEQLKKVCKVLKQKNAKVNRTCGLHIHFDASEFNLSHWKNIIWNYATLEPTIDGFLPNSRRGNNNQYCRSMRVPNYQRRINQTITLENLERSLTGRNRYFKVNIQSYWRHRTIEFRQHSGTIEFEKISNWILFLARFLEFSKTNKIQNGTFNELNHFLNQKLINYFQKRQQQFAA